MKRLKKFWIAAALVTLILSAHPPSAIAEEDDGKSGTFSIVMENDIFHSDRYYTNGVRASYLAKPGKRSEWARRAARLFPLFPEQATVQANYAIGQNMYTPKDITESNPSQSDRPYAGWLYGSIGLIAETGNWLDQLELTVGIVGPASLAEETQKFVHRNIGSKKPMGWDHQLKNEIGGVNLGYQRSWRGLIPMKILGFDFDLTPPHAGGAIGNIYTYANAGATVRYGKQLVLDYGPPRIQPSMPGSEFFVPQENLRWYVFAGIDGRAIARNIFIDGNTFENSRSADKEQFVGDLQYGIVLTKGKLRVSYTHVIRSREFWHQSNQDQNFGAVSVSMQF